MTDNANTFSGGEVIINPDSPKPQIIDGDKTMIERAMEEPQPHPWIAATNHPKPPSERQKPPDRFELTVQRHGQDKATATARCASMELLLDLNRQFEGIDYHFVKLERLGDD